MNIRVNESDLEYEDDALVYEGKPFSGIGFSKHPDGSLRKEISYRDGFPEGPCREWYENGQLSKEWTALKGEAPRLLNEWHANGTQKIKKCSEHGVELEFIEWDEDGQIVEQRLLDESSPMYQFLERMRKLKSS